ncbi:MAG TPA: hypothetical protein DCM28_18605 [Phycisphaerales bacterium]|nr:hypothetical protein [Phycisphaerales bacterium]HCD31690.1 hypothetical protein [Phycisphaerales bacterium]|tara:strand:+ start:337 stop:771 length:435 start_codon:yes stop_codon:yes gene_type:complete
MQIKTITVNKSEKNKEGVKIDVVVPASDVEIELLSFLMAGYIRDAATNGKFKVDLPDQYRITYQAEGSFLITTEPGVSAAKSGGNPFYTPPKPVAVVAIQRFGKRYDLAYAAINQEAFKTQKAPAPAAAPKAPKAAAKKAPGKK